MRQSSFVGISTLFLLFNFAWFVVPSKLIGLKDGGGGFREEGLELHNHYRSLNNVQPLQLDQELNKLAHAQAEKLASRNESLVASDSGFSENLWSHRGELLPLVRDLQYAIKCWYTGSKAPGGVEVSIDHHVLRSNSVKTVGFGVGTSEHNGEGYTVVVAYYQ